MTENFKPQAAGLSHQSVKALEVAQTKPARVLPRRDRQYLIEIVNGALTNKQG